MRGPVLALLLLISASATAQTAPNLYEEAVAARLGGDSARSATLLQQVVAGEPGNADAQLQLGLALLNLNRLDEAEAAFNRTLILAPDYADARIGLARVEQRRGNIRAAITALQPVDAGNAEAAELRRMLSSAAAGTPLWRMDVDGSYSWLDGPQPDWRELSVRLGYRASSSTTISGGLEFARRFGINDIYGELRLDHRFRDGLDGYVFFGATPDADFRPEWQVGAGGAVRVRSGGTATVLTLDATQARYRAGDIQTVNPGIDQYLANGRIWLGARWINIFDEDGDHRSGWLVRGDALPTPKLRIFAGAAQAPDITEGVVVETFSLFGGMAYDLNDRTNLRLSLAHEDRKTGSDRIQLSLGAGWKF